MRSKIYFIILFLLFSFSTFGKGSILDKVISVQIKSTPVKQILKYIEEVGKVKFSYNPELVNEKKVVTLNIVNKSIRFGLNLIFDNKFRFKEVGQHIVLLEKEVKKKGLDKTNSNIIFIGSVKNQYDGLPIAGASVYDIDSRIATLTDKNGKYHLSIPNSQKSRSLYFSKKGYRQFVIVLKTDENIELANEISLIPKEPGIEKISPHEVSKIPQTFEERALSGYFVSYETYTHNENLSEINETRMAQISFIPSLSIGSNLSTNGLITNHFSLNILSGYSKGIQGLEIGGILNIVKEEMNGVQIAGISNLVGGNVNGLQIGGIANLNKSHFNGFQISSITNINGGYTYGVQFTGIGNYVHGGFKGLQIGGITSAVSKDLFGVQINGLASVVKGGFIGVQISGLINSSIKNSYGFQLAGLQNVARHNLYGGQISCISNFAHGGRNFLQITGLVNFAAKNSGLQLAGGINRAKENNGLQIGLINTSRTSKGIALGLINFVWKGYHKTELSFNEITPLNLTFKSGVKRLYNTYHIGVKLLDRPYYIAGIGLGTYFELNDKMKMNIDLSIKVPFKEQIHINSQYYTSSFTVDYEFSKYFTVFMGPTFNTGVFLDNYENLSTLDWVNGSTKKHDLKNGYYRYWMGGQIGIRI